MDFDDDFASITKKPLKLKDPKKKKCDQIQQSVETLTQITQDPKVVVLTTTKAEEDMKKKQEQMAEQRILKKASKTHKERVEEFNKHLDSLSEHYDIPKVSWTK